MALYSHFLILPRLPVELIDHILEEAVSTSLDFTHISSLTLVSRHLRSTVLSVYFRILVIPNHKRWRQLACFMPKHATYTRSLQTTVNALTTNHTSFSFFSRLTSLTIDCSSEGLGSQHERFRLFFRTAKHLTILTCLKLTFIPRIGAPLLKNIAEAFPTLTSLSISSLERLDYSCCWDCLEESASSIRHSPIPDVYENEQNLANAFGKALKPLTHLQELSLGILLSNEEAMYDHTSKHDADVNDGFCSFGGEDDLLGVTGIKDCERCLHVWKDEIARREKVATETIMLYFNSLTIVQWGWVVSAEMN